MVKSLNTMNCNVMVDPGKLAERTDVFVSGDDTEAKAVVISILRDWFGWKSVIDLGDIATSRGRGDVRRPVAEPANVDLVTPIQHQGRHLSFALTMARSPVEGFWR